MLMSVPLRGTDIMKGALSLRKGLELGVRKTVEALLKAGQLKHVADLVAYSQPVATFALSKLRETIDDPLLVAGETGTQLTARARKLAAPMRQVLERIRETLSGNDVFDPAFCDDAFVVAASAHAAAVIGPRLAATLAARAPRATLALMALESGALRKQLDSGVVHLGIGAVKVISAELKSEKLYTEQFRCIARKNHPRIARRLSAKQYAEEGHVVVRTARRGSEADPGRDRRVAVTVADERLAAAIVARSELIATLPERVAKAYAEHLPLQLLAPPVRLPSFTVMQIWHPREDGHAAHRWLRGVIAEVIDDA